MILNTTWQIVSAMGVEAICVFFITYFISTKGRVAERSYYDVVIEKAGLEERLRENLEENAGLKQKIQNLHLELQEARDKALVLDIEKKNLERTNMQFDAFLKSVDEQTKLHFENLANKIFDEKMNKFSKMSREGLHYLLEPVKENMQILKKELEEAFVRQGKEQFSLKNEIQRIVLANERITLQAENLASALKGNNKLQGSWGEVILEKVLEDSGLRRDQDYKMHSAGMSLTGITGGKQYPDVVVLLPEDKHIVVDSKVSLVHYERYCSEKQDENLRLAHLKQFVHSVRSHVNDLAGKRYTDIDSLNTPDFVLMFIPIESAYFLMVRADTELHGYAWCKKVVIVCPSTLLATLRTIESLWRLEKQNRNTLEIARQGGALYDKIAGFIQDMQKLGKQLDVAGCVYRDAMKKLSEGHGNILSRTKNLKNLGVKASKSLEIEAVDG
ncbi:rmuC family protein [Anaplasma phagocytophilum str. ApWI1]|uniref:DNA recombination protein RmuC homolog n=2 Tax=Anaplasma phagocytophilum TaxID=948 RepID=A0A0F3PZJ3_ANAPH|nr:DNA recombination protein RmuC [Anaplasma phagocytophilum]AGR81290.1 DNA recombination protein RmuC [Anaplasma phagocytophilum str. Dog2]EOA60791.1 putative DNA recombination protein RmuC [Anaplasma phagocytophilum str. HGE1]KJV85301.1 rmuC family protein [Anaplasma phagocytophilum str. ApWI1]KJV99373.1 rmuC family protein [Anaplasma phagocytophilum str. Annie]